MSDAEKYVRRGYAPGNYCCICQTCNGQFIGEKQSWCCLGCAKAADRIEELEATIAKLQARIDLFQMNAEASKARDNVGRRGLHPRVRSTLQETDK